MGARAELFKSFNAKYMATDTAGRLKLVREYFAEDYECHEPPELPMGGTFRGWDAGPRISAIYRALWDLELVDMIILEEKGSDTLVMRTTYKWTSKETGRVFIGPVLELVAYNSEGKIQSFEVFHFDPAGLVATLPGRD